MRTTDDSKVNRVNPFRGFTGSRIALFSNSKPNVNFLYDEIKHYLSTVYPTSSISLFAKLSAAVKTPGELIAATVEAADCAIVAMAD
jgi:hypothetical protein